jgi:hypothetical protein
MAPYRRLFENMLFVKTPALLNILIPVGILVLLVGASSGYATASLLIGPYTQQSTEDSVIISWMTDTPTRRDQVHWGINPGCDNIRTELTIFPKTLHTITLKGLSAGQQYYYHVRSDETDSPLYTFWTAFPHNDTLKVVVYGDSQGEWDDWQAVSLVARAIEVQSPAIVLKTGDLVDKGWNLSQWIKYFTASPFLHNSTLYPILGNHENYSCLYFSFFSFPRNERWFSFENGPAHFVGLDSNSRSRYRLAQYLWLIHDLRTHQEPFTVVFFHHPPYSSSNHGNTTILQKIWSPVFERYHVDVVFNGHDHNYERSIVNNVTYIVTGGGGSPLYNNGHSPWTVYSEKTYHYCLLTASPSGLTCETKTPEGLVIDSFSLLP